VINISTSRGITSGSGGAGLLPRFHFDAYLDDHRNGQVLVRIPLVLIGAFVLVGPRVVTGQVPETLYLATRAGVACHTGPRDDLPAGDHYHVGDVIDATKSARGTDGSLWYSDAWRASAGTPCWVQSRFTVPYDRRNREAAYVAIADSLLVRKDSVPFEDYVDVVNLLESGGPDAPERGPGVLVAKGTSLFERYPRLRYERLLIIDRAIQRLRTSAVADDPLTRAWIVAHADILYYYEPDGEWDVPASAYWSIYEANRTADWAEPVAWTAAQHLGGIDECDPDCYLSLLSHGPEAYWSRLPLGAHVGDAVALATRIVTDALTVADVGAPTRRTIDSIRASLGPVNAPEKGKLLDLLEQLERKAK